MRKVYLLFVAVIVIPTTSQVRAAETIGEMLIYCSKPDGNVFRVHCHSYMGGIIDVQANFGLSANETVKYTCVPSGVTSRQGAAVFVRWANKNPEHHHLPAFVGVVESLHETFKCPETQ